MWTYWAHLPIFLVILIATKVSSTNNIYDYIVVGSGPGGGPLAANLAKAGYSTLLLEAGDDQGETLAQEVAQWSSVAYNDPLARWDFFVKQSSDQKITDKYNHLVWKTTDGQFYVGKSPPAGAVQLGVYYPRAGTLGGCSTHNALCAALPSNTEWDEIMNITGDPSWSYQNMRKYLIQVENNTYVPKGTPGHGFQGFLTLSINSNESLMNQTQAVTVFKAAAKQAGQDPDKLWEYLQRDLNSDRPGRDEETGWFGFPGHRDLMGRRVSARNAVVQVNNAVNANGSKKYPLTLSLHSLATKILFDKFYKTKAIGVEYLSGQSMYAADPRYNAKSKGVTMQAFARKEVIIAGGTFNSPQLLMLSGIGPKAQLAKLGIPVLVDLPGVGANLQDNTEFGYIANAATDFVNRGMDATCTFGAVIPNVTDSCLEAWKQGRGPYAQGPIDSLMLRSSVAYKNERDIFIFALPGVSFQGYWPGTTVNTIPRDPATIFDFSIVKMRPNNKLGTLTLISANPRDVPSINFRFFEQGGEIDLQAIADAVDFGRKTVDSVPPPIGPFKEVLPCADGSRTCNVKETIRAQAWSHHATSTCAIGADKDKMAVLDSKFRVRGTKSLRVVDASAFPRTPGAFPVLPTFMISYKATEVILADAKVYS